MAVITKQIELVKSSLQQGRVVAIPTETVYGLAGNAYSRDTVLQIFDIKKRPLSSPLIVHTDSLDKASGMVKHISEKAMLLAQVFWPGPLALILPKKDHISHEVTAGRSDVAIRVPSHPLALQLLQSLDFPLVATSANLFGQISPTHPEHVALHLGEEIDYILDGGVCSVGLESTIVDCQGEQATLCRIGAIPQVQIEAVIGPVRWALDHHTNQETPSGSTSYHIFGKLFIVGDLKELVEQYRHDYSLGILAFRKYDRRIAKENQFVLSPHGLLSQAASNLFKGLHYLEQLPVDMILAEYLPAQGIGKTINDRLSRCATSKVVYR